jgi:hypothetical protein
MTALTFQHLGLHFKKLELADAPILQPFLEKHPQSLTGYTFSVLMAWRKVYRYAWAFLDPETLLISCVVDESSHPNLLMPIGAFGPLSQEKLLAEVRALPSPLRLFGVSKEFIDSHGIFFDSLLVRSDRDGANYIYSVEELATLAGKKFQKKRNLVSQAQRSFQWTVENVSLENLSDCEKVLDLMEAENLVRTDAAKSEMMASRESVALFEHLSLQGILIRVDTKPVALSLWEEQTPGTAVIHCEKASREYKGLYQVVNNESAKRLHDAGFQWVNREDDGGNEGQRQAKLTYNPAEIREPFFCCSAKKSDNPNNPWPCNRGW